MHFVQTPKDYQTRIIIKIGLSLVELWHRIGIELKWVNPRAIGALLAEDVISAIDEKTKALYCITTEELKKILPEKTEKIVVKNVSDIVNFNNTDTITHAPYNQNIFTEIVNDSVSDIKLKEIKKLTKMDATDFLNELMTSYNFDVFVSIDNSMAGIAAAAHFPALTVPMGYRNNGEPSNITFITSSNNEQILYNIAYLFEKNFKRRKAPKNYN